MSFKCGIVGLPNVGKSTLFNALTNSSKAQAANFPFCTIDPNVGVVSVPDKRLNKLSVVSKSKTTIFLFFINSNYFVSSHIAIAAAVDAFIESTLFVDLINREV